MKARRNAFIPISILLPILAVCLLMLPAAAHAEETIRVGWHEEPYFITDQLGRRSGYTYDYQRKIAAYTGWKYEYVEGSWSELLQMLKDGEIDMMGNISYMKERAKDILYASLPMGTEAYYLFISPDNTEIKTEDFSSLSGKKIGVAKGSIQSDMLSSWIKTHGIKAEITELTTTEEESLRMLGNGLDAFVTVDVYGDPDTAVPVWKMGSSDFFFAVSNNRPDLVTELNAAMNSIQDENKYYNQELHEKYLENNEPNLFLSSGEKEWLSQHGTIRIGYQDNYLAFCARDEETGELIGALKDYLEYASDCMENAQLDFEAVAYPTAAAAIEGLKNGEVDCMFPANMTEYDGEVLGLVLTPALMHTEMDAVVRADDQREFVRRDQVTVAVNEGNTNYEIFLTDHFPGWQTGYYENTQAGLHAVANGEADCLIISNYRFNNIAKLCSKLHLTTVYTGVDMDYCIALCEGDTELYSIITKTITALPDSTIHKALTYYSSEDAKTSLADYLMDNLVIVLLIIVIIVLVILILLLHSITVEKKVAEEKRLIHVLNERAYVDALTSVRNKGAFVEYIQNIQDRVDASELAEFAVGVFDCDDLKLVNDWYGHDKGDIYLKTASHLICTVFQHSPVFRIGGDEFTVILQGDDFKNREALIREFNAQKDELCAINENRWDQVQIAIGIAVYDPRIDKSVNDTVRRADKIMYENKRMQKKAGRERRNSR